MKALIWLFIIGLLASAGAYYYLSMQQSPDEKPYVVEKKFIRRAVHGAGVVEGSSVAVRLKFPFGGQIDDLDAREGEIVKQGAVIAKLNTTDIDSRIKLEEAALKEANAKRDALKARKDADLVTNARFALEREQADVREWELRVDKLKSPAANSTRQDQLETVTRIAERARLALALAEAELKQLKSHPTPDEMAVATARLDAAKLRGKETEATAAELRYALAEYDKTKRGPNEDDLAAAVARVNAARGELERAESEKQKLEKPQPPPPLPLREIAQAEAALAEAKQREKEKRETLNNLRKNAEAAEVLAAEAAVESATERLEMLKNMKKGYEMRAPFDALVTKRLTEGGALVQPFEDVFWIIDFRKKRVRAEFDVMALSSLIKTPNLKAAIKSRAFGKDELGAHVLDIGKVGPRRLMLEDPSQPKGGEVVEVLLEVEKPDAPEKKEIYDKLLRPGLRAEANIVLESTAEAVICVPISYVSSDKGDQFVWKVEMNTKSQKLSAPIRKKVDCGLRDEYYVEIKGDGLRVEDLLVKPKPQGK